VKLGVFKWSEGSNTYAAAYYFENVSGSYVSNAAVSRWQLTRYYCTGGGSATSVVTARELANPTAAATQYSLTVSGALTTVKLYAYKGLDDLTAYPFTFQVLSRTQANQAGAITPPGGGAGPNEKTSMSMYDGNTTVRAGSVRNGKIDAITVTFLPTAAVSDLCNQIGPTGQWSLANAPTGATIASVTRAANIFTINLVEGAVNTSVNTFTGTGQPSIFTVTFAPTPGVCSLDGFQDESPLDEAAPVITSFTSTNAAGNTAGKPEPNDTVVFGYSENVVQPAATTETLTLTRSGSTSAMTISDVNSVSINLQSAYQNPNTAVTFGATITTTEATSTVSAKLTVTMGTCDAATDCNKTNAGSTAVITPTSALVTDDAGNAAVPSLTALSAMRLF
jgi:hypothetical protein